MKRLTISLVLAALIFCTPPVRNSARVLIPDSVEKQRGKTPRPYGSPPPQALQKMDEIPQVLSPPQWIGKKFVILPKQKLLCAQGYFLTTCRQGECAAMSIDPEWENRSHRVLCSKAGGDSVYVEAVEPDSNEWLVTFAHIPTEKRLYARTHKQAINETALSDDLIAARKRWLHTVVFSKKGVISQIGSSPSTSISSKRIRIQDSLQVVDVRWGMTPLPVNPIWLVVRTADSTEGFIPVRVSWTNTMIDRRTDRRPWDEDIYETDPAVLYEWDENMWETINNHRVILEMTADQVTASWGYPLSVEPLQVDSTSDEIWTYPSQKLHFHDNKLVAISERESP